MKSDSGAAPVAYILKRYPRLSETFILNEIRAMERLGERLHIFSLLPPEPPPHHPMVAEVRSCVHAPPVGIAARLKLALRAHAAVLFAAPLGYARALAAAVGWTLTSRKPVSLWRQFVRAGAVAHLCRTHQVRHVHAHFANAPTTVAHFVHLMTGLPFSFTAHAKDIYLSRPSVIRRRLQAATFAATCTGYNAVYLRTLAPQVSPRKIRLVYHGIDLDLFARSTVAAGERARPLILSVGRLVPKKGHEDLIRACAALRNGGVDFECLIVGSGPLRDALESAIVSHGLEQVVSLRGAMTHAQLIELYRRADLFVLAPRIAENGDRDGIPNVIAEAMAIGVPVIASDISGIPELVRHGQTGLLVPSRAPAAMAAAMRQLLADRQLAGRLACEARRRLEADFDLWETTRALQGLMSTAVDLRQRAPGESRAQAQCDECEERSGSFREALP
jgi:glycosyltransferase involved in cell wall biosynthesis